MRLTLVQGPWYRSRLLPRIENAEGGHGIGDPLDLDFSEFRTVDLILNDGEGFIGYQDRKRFADHLLPV